MQSYPFDDVTPQPEDTGDAAAAVPAGASPIGSRVRKIATGAAIGVAVLATGGVAIAATHTGSATAAGGPGGGGPGGGFGEMAGGGSLANALHGTFVVPATSGTGTTTEDLQTGKVTAVNATSISVTSTDKTAGTFVVTSSTKFDDGESKISDVKVGNTVTVIATDTDKKALTIEDRTLDPAGGGHGGFPGGGRGGFPGGGHGGGMPAGSPPSGAPAAQGGGTA